jgi:hypothetical protein
LLSSQIMNWVRSFIITSSNEQKIFYLKGIGWKRTFIQQNSWWNPLTHNTILFIWCRELSLGVFS